jgi:hypothetical protein
LKPFALSKLKPTSIQVTILEMILIEYLEQVTMRYYFWRCQS